MYWYLSQNASLICTDYRLGSYTSFNETIQEVVGLGSQHVKLKKKFLCELLLIHSSVTSEVFSNYKH